MMNDIHYKMSDFGDFSDFFNDTSITDDVNNTYKTVDNAQQLAQLDDEIKEITNFPKYDIYETAVAIIDGRYPSMGFDHQNAMERAAKKYKIMPRSLIRGFIDTDNRLAFIFIGIINGGPFLKYAQHFAKTYNYIEDSNDIINNIDDIAKMIKKELNINKVYALHYPEANQVQRLAKLIQ